MTPVIKAAENAPIVGPIREASRSPAQLRDCVRSLAVQHEVEPRRGALDGFATGAVVGGVHLAYVRYGAPTRVVAQPTGDAVCWTVPIGPMGVAFGDGVAAKVGEGFVLGRDTETFMLPNPHRGAVVVTTTQARLARHHDTLTGHLLPPLAIEAGPARGSVTGLVDSAWRHVALVLRATPSPNPSVAATLEELLLTSLLLELSEVTATILLATPEDRALGREHARRAADWAREHLAETVTMASWARGVGLSVRHLQKVFRDVHGCSPGQYLQRVRLEHAHRLLQRGGTDETVTSIAAQAGFTHLGRFAAAYRERYATPPSSTLHRRR